MSTPSLIDDNNPVWLPAFKLFLSKVKIASKEFREPGPITLYRAQNMFLDELADGIREGTRHFVVLKARQLGLSTVMLVLDIFWLYMNPGLQGALIADNAINRDDFRKQVAQIMDSLPKGWRVAVAANNRDELRLANGSVLRYLSAGKGKNSGLGRSKGLAYVHATEISSWGDQKGIDSLMDALAIENPNRLFVFESTALGFNVFHDMWEKAKSNAPAERAIFIGWWAKDIYRHAEGSAMFERWWGANPEMDEYEQVVFNIVQEAYGWEITPEQWSWYRERASMRSTDSMQEEMPSTEDEAFTSTGHSFFNLKRVDDDVKFITQARPAFNGYNYELHDNFLKMKLHPAVSVDGLELRVWEPPKKRGKYVIGVDPAYGRNEEADRSVVSVWRCFSDKVVQVAEYATPMPETQQVAWVMCHLASEYRDCIINLEISGPGGQIMQEMNSLRQHLQWGHLSDTARQMQVEDCLNGARWFLYHRPDSMGAGYCYNWKTSFENKLLIFNKFRDCYSMEQAIVRSRFLLDEMSTLKQDGDRIAASGSHKDDRIFAACLAVYAWDQWRRVPMMAEGQTYASEMAQQKAGEDTHGDKVLAGIIPQFFQDRQRDRVEAYYRSLET